MSGRLVLEAPAKVNLGLRIVGRRADGYHLLESLFVPLDWGDSVAVAVSSAGSGSLRVVLEGVDDLPDVPSGAGNLAVRAARAFLERASLTADVALRLEKRIPAGAGLGGGSSDAGAVLRGLARLLPGAVSGRALHGVAAGLGADVPFFLDPRPTWVTGVGEALEPLDGIPALPLLLVSPGVPLATARVYGLYDESAGAEAALTPSGASPTLRSLRALCGGARSGDAGPDGLRAFLRALRGAEGGEPLLHNDLEASAVRLCPAVATLRREIERVGAEAVGLSGSGPTLFGVFASADDARAASERIALPAPAHCRVVTTRPSPEAGGGPGGADGPADR